MAETNSSRSGTAGPKRVEVKLLKAHVHRREVCGPDTDRKTISVREDQARRLRHKGIAE